MLIIVSRRFLLVPFDPMYEGDKRPASPVGQWLTLDTKAMAIVPVVHNWGALSVYPVR